MDIATGMQKARRFVASLSVITLLAGFTVANVAQAATFQDVPADAWFYTYVEQLASAGILDTTQANYRPADNANRAEAAKLLVEAAGLTIDTSSGPSFKDVAPGAWYYQYVETAAKNGIVTGYTDAAGNLTGMFGPGDSVTREQFSKMAVKALNLTQVTTGGPHFPDEPTSSWSYPYVETLYNWSVIDGYPDGTFRPTNDINRAEIAKMVVGAQAPVKRGTTGTGGSAAFNVSTASAVSATSVVVMFSQNVDATTGAMPTNYSIKDAAGTVLAVTAAAVSATQVTLTTATQTADDPYQLTVNTGVKEAVGTMTLSTNTANFNGYNALGPGGPLTVALDANTPKSMSVPLGASGVVFTCWDFTAGSAATAIQSLTIHRIGAGTQSDFANVYLYNGAERLTTGRAINSQDQTVDFSNINVNIAAGGMAKLCAVADISTTAQAAAQHAFEIQASTAITTNASSVSGTFPQTGNLMTIAGGTVGTAFITSNGSLSQITIGQQQARIAQFQISANGNEDESLQRIALDIRGTIQNNDVTNFNLYVTGGSSTTALATTAAVDSNGLATFVLATPYTIPRGTNKIFYVLADVTGRDQDQIKVYLDQPTDALIVGNTFGFGDQINDITNVATANGGVGVGVGGYDGGSVNVVNGPFGFSSTTVKGSTFTLAFNGPAAGNIAVGQSNASCMNMTLTNASGSPVDLHNWVVEIKDTSANLYLGTQSNFTLIKLAQMNADGSLGPTLLGSNELSTAAGASTSDQLVTLSGDYNLAAGASIPASIIFNVGTGATNGDVVTCTLKDLTSGSFGEIRDVNNDTLTANSITPSGDIVGNQMTVSSAGLTFTVAGTPSAQTMVTGTQNAALLGLSVSSGTTLSNTIESLSLQGYVLGSPAGANTWQPVQDTTNDPPASGSTTLQNEVSSLGLYMNGTLVSQLQNVDSSTGKVIFNNLNIFVPANGTINLTLQGNISNSAPYGLLDDAVKFSLPAATNVVAIDSNGQTVATTGIQVAGAVNGGADTINADNTAHNVWMDISSGGTGTSGQVATSTVANVVTGDPVNQLELARWKFTSTNQTPALNDLQVGVLEANGSNPGNIFLYSGSTCSTAVGSGSGYTSSNGIYTITSLNVPIPEGSNLTLCAKGIVNNVGNGNSNPLTGSHVGLVLLNVTKVTGGSGTNIADKYNSNEAGALALNGALTTATTAIVLTGDTADGVNNIVPGDVLSVGSEMMLVTAMNLGTHTATVIRGFANTTPAIASTAARVGKSYIATASTTATGAIAAGVMPVTATAGINVGDVIAWNDTGVAGTLDYALVTAVCTANGVPVLACTAANGLVVTTGLYGGTTSAIAATSQLTDFTFHGPLNVLRGSRPVITLNSTPSGSFALPISGTDGAFAEGGATKTPTTGTVVLNFNVAASGQNDVTFNQSVQAPGVNTNSITVQPSGKMATPVNFTCSLTDGTKYYDTEQVNATTMAPIILDFYMNQLTVSKGTNTNLQVVCDLKNFTTSKDNFGMSLVTSPSVVKWNDGTTGTANPNDTTDGALIVPTTLTSPATYTAS